MDQRARDLNQWGTSSASDGGRKSGEVEDGEFGEGEDQREEGGDDCDGVIAMGPKARRDLNQAWCRGEEIEPVNLHQRHRDAQREGQRGAEEEEREERFCHSVCLRADAVRI